MSILISGANGFIGSHLARYLSQSGHSVIRLGRKSDARPDFFKADLAESVPDLPQSVETVIHLAAASPKPGQSVDKYIENNIRGTKNLLTACGRNGIQRLLFASAVDCYMNIFSDIVNEASANGPSATMTGSTYGWSKLMCEHLLQQMPDQFQSLILRLPGIIGSGCGDVWINRVTTKMRGNDPVECYALEKPFNCTLHIEDLCGFIGGQVDVEWKNGCDLVNLACDNPLPISQILAIIKEATGSASPLIEGFPHKQPFLISIEKAKKEYGFVPSTVLSALSRYLAIKH